MNYTGIIEMIREGLEEERQVVSDIEYKRGVRETIEKLEKENTEDEDELIYAEGYLDGLEEAFEVVYYMLGMSNVERIKLFGDRNILDIIEDNHPLDIVKALLDYIDPDEDEPDVIYSSGISEEAKELIDDLIKNIQKKYSKENDKE